MRYKSNTFLATAKRKSALIFQESILYEPTDTTLFRRSYFTGSSPASTEDCFNPQASIFMLAAYDIFGTFLEADLDTNTVAYNDPSKIFFNTFKSILNSIVGEKKGRRSGGRGHFLAHHSSGRIKPKWGNDCICKESIGHRFGR